MGDVFPVVGYSTLQVEATWSSVTFEPLYQYTRRHMPDDSNADGMNIVFF